MNQDEIKTFECDLDDSNLFNCILEEVGEEDINQLSNSSQQILDKTFINCLNASLVNCLRINREKLDFPNVHLQLAKSPDKNWLIKQINIIVDKQLNDNLIYDRINQCLKFVKQICKTGEDIQLSISKSDIKGNLKDFKVQLKELNQLLNKIREDKSEKERLFSIFRDMTLNK
ncbi:MAG: hypothetical protein ACFFEY_08020 [Candidatus Thorarchaeota archaeon]